MNKATLGSVAESGASGRVSCVTSQIRANYNICHRAYIETQSGSEVSHYYLMRYVGAVGGWL